MCHLNASQGMRRKGTEKTFGEFVAGLHCLIAVLMFAGCSDDSGPKFALVSGTVNWEGKPLAYAKVIFQPETARPSYGYTDPAGNYQLAYSVSQKGAIQGAHTVRISMASPDELSEEDARVVSQFKKRLQIPSQYNTQTELTADVKKGKNKFDFSLNP